MTMQQSKGESTMKTLDEKLEGVVSFRKRQAIIKAHYIVKKIEEGVRNGTLR